MGQWQTVHPEITVRILKIRTLKELLSPIIILKLEQYHFTTCSVIGPKDADRMANSVDPDQTAPLETV